MDERKRTLQNFANRSMFWDLLLGPVYNRMTPKAVSEVYARFTDEVSPPENSRILDVGSGPGHVCLMLARKHPTVEIVGIDFSRTEVRAAERLRRKNHVTNCRFQQGDAMALPFEDASFDIVISLASLKHWPDRERGLNEIRRVLVPGGRSLVLEADSGCTDDEFAHFASQYYSWWVSKRFFNWYARLVTVSQSITPVEAESMAAKAGFDEVAVEKVVGWPFWIMSLVK